MKILELEEKRMLRYDRRDIALALFDIGAFKDKKQSPDGKGFKLKLHEKSPDAPLSPFYLNLRTQDNPKPGPLTPALVTVIGKYLYGIASERRLLYHAVSGIPKAGEPFARAFLLASRADEGTKLLELEKTENEGGRKISGLKTRDFTPQSRVLLIDDVSTQWESKFEAIEVLKAHHLEVRDIIVVVNREQASFAKENKKRAYHLHALFRAAELSYHYLMTGCIDRPTYDEILLYLGS